MKKNLRFLELVYSVKADMRSKDFVSAFFIAITSGHSVQKWKGKEMNREDVKKLLLAIIAVVIACIFRSSGKLIPLETG